MTFTFFNVFYIFLKVFYIFYVGAVGLDRSPSLTTPAATLLYKFYLNQALLFGAKVAAGPLFPWKM